MEEGPDYSKDKGCRHSDVTIHHLKKPARWSSCLLLTVAYVTLGGSIPVGYICGTSTNPYHVEDSWVQFKMATLRTMLLLGGIVGALSVTVLADRIGRRSTIVTSEMVGVVGAGVHLVASITHSQTIMIIAWLILGVSVGVGVSILPMYLVEIAPLDMRASLGVIFTVGTAIGLLLSEILSLHSALAVGSGHPFLVPIFVLPVIVSWFIYPHVPESPKYLQFVKKDLRSAASETARLRGIDPALAEMGLNCDGAADTEAMSSSSQLLNHPLHLVIVCAAHLSQAFGQSDQLYHLSAARPRLAEADVVATGYTASVINSIVALMLVHLVSAVSWQMLLIVSCVSSSVLLLVMSAFALQEDCSDKVIYLMLITLLIQVVVFDLGLRSIPYFLACELFHTRALGTVMALGGAVNFLGHLIADYMFIYLSLAHFRFFAALFLAFFVVMLLISPKYDPNKEENGPEMSTLPKPHLTVSSLPNPQ